MKRALCIAVLFLTGLRASAQNQTPVTRLLLNPFGSARSQPFPVLKGETLVVRPVREGELLPAIYIYEEKGDLVAKNDEEADSAAFEYDVPEPGSLYVVMYSNSESPVEYTVTRLPYSPTRAAPAQPDVAVVKVYWATNRNVLNRLTPKLDTELDAAGTVTYGVSEVNIPRAHKMGELEGPAIWRVFVSDSDKRVAVSTSEVKDAVRFFKDVAQASRRDQEPSALIFVHGFNTKFEDATRRTAQMTYDLGFRGAPILFSWPSQGEISAQAYNKDKRNADLSPDTLRDLIRDLVKRGNIKRIHIIAHSMGNVVLTQALQGLQLENAKIHQIALLAPDIDAQLFRKLAREFPKSASHVTLYASSRDYALLASQKIAGYPRAGQGGKEIVVVPGMDTIDASVVDTSLLGVGHQYYGDSSQILSDLFYLFQGLGPDSRFGLRRVQASQGSYWMFNAAAR